MCSHWSDTVTGTIVSCSTSPILCTSPGVPCWNTPVHSLARLLYMVMLRDFLRESSGFPLNLEKCWVHVEILCNFEKINKSPWKIIWNQENWVGTNKAPFTSRFGGPSVQFMIIFPKDIYLYIFFQQKFQYYLPNFSSLSMLDIFLLFYLIFIPVYRLVHYILIQAI